MMPGDAIELPDGLCLRAGGPGDVDQIVDQNVQAFGAQDGPDVRLYLDQGPGPEAWSVVVDGSRVVSSVGGLPLRLRLDGTDLPTYQVEYVVTDPAFQRRGLVRAQIAWHHRRSAQRGDLVQVIAGIPYVYRRFGYGYGFDHPPLFHLDADRLPAMPPVTVRDAQPSDVAALVSLERLRPAVGVRTVRDESVWALRSALAAANPHHHLLVALVDDVVCGWARLFDEPDLHRSDLLPSLATDRDVAIALLRATLERAGDKRVEAFDGPGTVFGRTLHEVGTRIALDFGFYARVADPVALLETLRPVLSERLARSHLSNERGDLAISLYRHGVRLEYDGGEVRAVRECPPVEDPLENEGVGVAPDWFPALVLGRWGATELARRVDDVLLGRHGELMEILFPRLTSDVAGDF
jgi:hypothetical protein